MFENILTFWHDLKFAVRSLTRAKGLMVTVVATLALGIGANAAMFALVRGVLLRPLVNRDENRLIYIRQSAEGIGFKDATFSVPEIVDLRSRMKTVSAFGDFSTIGFTMVGLGEPREVRAGVVGGSYFEVMGLRPVLGRLLDARDDGPSAAGAVVLTYRFWSTALKSDPSVIGKTVRLGSFDNRTATVVGVLEPCVPYPAETEIIANIVTSAHHLSATMVTGRVHRMTELFARLAPGASLDAARAELQTVYRTMKREHPEAYPARADFRVSAVRLRDQLTAGARTILLVLMAASVLVFVIACSNVANLILARTVRREGELGIRAALGASTVALRRTLLAESLLLCGAGAAIGMVIAGPMASVLARYASRFSMRALDLTVDSSMLWVGGALAVVAAALLALVPRLPSSGGVQGFGLAAGVRATGMANRRLRVFAVIQIAASFVLVASAGATVKTLLSLEHTETGLDTRHVLAVDVPVMDYHKTPAQVLDFYRQATERIRELPNVENVAIGSAVPWRDAVTYSFALELTADGQAPAPAGEGPRSTLRVVTPGFFATLGLPILAGRDFNQADRQGTEPVAIISQSLAERLFPGRDALNHHILWTDPVMKFVPLSVESRRIVGVVPDLDDQHVEPQPTNTVYHPFDQEESMGAGRLFVHVRSNPYGLVTPITAVLRKMSADQPVEHAATLEDIRAEVLSPDRLNAVVFGAFAGVALLIAVVGVAGVLAFSVSGRTREFGIRLAVGARPRYLLLRVIAEGAAMAVGGIAAGLAAGYGMAQLAGTFLSDLQMPGTLPVAGSALVLLIAAAAASAIPAARAARVDVVQALRTE